ncbi:MAG: hypothetical protein HKN33_05705 [Pyrinomonadaceae bacterium]|nr:hypothetical protein [Pyrinomonadaceae bacterium]
MISSIRFLLLVSMVVMFVPIAFGQTGNQRQFDFWVGAWDVNLRVQQKDNSWKDQHKSTAHIYKILAGKAILELWSENKDGINGYSLRYYNPNTDKWDLWLNWPGKNRSGTTGLTGSFRHGRGEFFAERKIDERTTQIRRYTFSDATPTSLRWDDAYSTDGGKTWSSNWIMEFSRRAGKAPGIEKEKNLLTYFEGNRCDLPEFDVLRKIINTSWAEGHTRYFNVLDGCMIIGFLGEDDHFFTLTYNTYASTYEFTLLGKDPSAPLSIYYGSKDDGGLSLKTRKKDGRSDTAELSIGGDGYLWAYGITYNGGAINVNENRTGNTGIRSTVR